VVATREWAQRWISPQLVKVRAGPSKFRKVKQKKKEREREREREIKRIDGKEGRRRNTMLHYDIDIGNMQDQASPERGFPSTSSLIRTRLTVGETFV